MMATISCLFCIFFEGELGLGNGAGIEGCLEIFASLLFPEMVDKPL